MEKLALKYNEKEDMYQVWKAQNLLCNLVKIPEGQFLRKDGRTVKISSFYLGQFAVTQELYREVLGKTPSRFQGDDRPVERVSWYEAVEFCDILSRQLDFGQRFYQIDKASKDPNNISDYDKEKWIVNFNKSGRGFRLPTEAEWEYAAKGRKQPVAAETYPGSKFLDTVGWYDSNSGGETKAVGLKFPNAFGLFDMGGNVWEWCYDWYADYNKTDLENPIGPKSGSRCVRRGGGWISSAVSCRSESRNDADAGRRGLLGFRLVFVP